MTPEEKQAEETAKAEAEAKAKAEKEKADAEFEASIADLSDEDKEAKRAEREAGSNDPSNIDYKAELEKERLARKKAEDALAAKRFKNSDSKRKKDKEDDGQDDDDDEDEDETPLTPKSLQKILAQERQTTEKRLTESRAREIVRTMTTSADEANLILEIHKNRTFPEHLSLEDQIEEAYAIANRKKLIGERNEALRALRGKSGVNDDPSSSHKGAQSIGEPKLAPQDSAAIKASGFAWNGTSKRYEKKLSNGGLLIHDPKTKKTFLQKKGA